MMDLLLSIYKSWNNVISFEFKRKNCSFTLFNIFFGGGGINILTIEWKRLYCIKCFSITNIAVYLL